MGKQFSGLNRRDLLKLGGMTLASTFSERVIWPLKVSAAGKVTPRRNARSVIFIELPGAISTPDCWDFKETKSTPKDFDIQKATSDLYLSKTLFPNHSYWAPKASFVRSMRGQELVHFLGQYHTQTGRAMNVALSKEIPAFGSIIAYELDSERRETDTFPTYMSVNLSRGRTGAIGSGFLPPRFAGLDLDSSSALETFGGSSEKKESSNAILMERWQALERMGEVSPVSDEPIGEKVTEYNAFYKNAYKVLGDTRWSAVFKVSEEEKKRYSGDFAMSLLLARNVLAADAGTRFIYVNHCGNGGNGPWDNHASIYGTGQPGRAEQPVYVNCPLLDRGLTNLVQDLLKMPGKAPGKTLFEETMIIVTSEFGRTPEVNPAGGRDHWAECYTTMYLGGGVKPGRIIGKTDETCSKVIDTGWNHKEQPSMDNTVATIYSALGIDWTKTIEKTPSGRGYDYVQMAPVGGSQFQSNDEISALFV